MQSNDTAANTPDTADVVVLALDENSVAHVLLVLRSDDSDAFPACWALPGGYVDPGETARQAAERELREETGLNLANPDLTLVGRYDAPGRDPRGPVASEAFLAVLPHTYTPTAGDDAVAAHWVPLHHAKGLAFDHDQILADARALNRL